MKIMVPLSIVELSDLLDVLRHSQPRSLSQGDRLVDLAVKLRKALYAHPPELPGVEPDVRDDA